MKLITWLTVVGTILQLVGVVLTIVSISTVHWTLLTDKKAEYGLWRFCLRDLCQSINRENGLRELRRPLLWCRLMSLFSTVFSTFNLFQSFCVFQCLLPLGLTCKYCRPVGIAVQGVISAASMLVCVGVWVTGIHKELGSQKSRSLGYSFNLALVGQSLVAAGVLLSLCCYRRFKAQNTFKTYEADQTVQQQEQMPLIERQ